MQTEEVERLEKEALEPDPGAEKLQVSADGAMVPLMHGVCAEGHVNPMLAIRNIICSGRWSEEWPKIEARLLLLLLDNSTI